MTRWREGFDRIGGPDAVTWAAFWVTYVFGIVAHLSTGGNVDASIAVRIAIVTFAQVASFLPLLLLRATLLRDPPRPRPWTAVLGFVVSGITRGAVLSWLLLAIGAVDEPRWAYRIAAGLQNQVVLLIIVALVVSTMRMHTRSLEALIAVQRELVRADDEVIQAVSARNEQLLEQVQDRLRSELTRLEGMPGQDSVRELQRLASDVVRPLSHELAASVPQDPLIASPTSAAHVTWREAALQIIDRPPLRPVAAAAFMAGILIIAALGLFGVARGIPLAIVAATCVVVGSTVANRVLGRVLPRLGQRGALVAVLLASLAVGYGTTALSILVVPEAQQPAIVIAAGLFVGQVVLLIAIVTTILRQQKAAEGELVHSTERLRRELVRRRQLQWVQQRGLSRALHGPVQAAVTSAAIRLDAAVAAGDVDAALLDSTRADLLASIDVLERSDEAEDTLDLAMARISGTWDGICEVTFDIDDASVDRLGHDTIAAAVVFDLMTEAVSNAVRHGEAQLVRVAIGLDGDGLLTLTVADDGRGADRSPMRGLGSSLLDDCTLSWKRESSPEGCALVAMLPSRSG